MVGGGVTEEEGEGVTAEETKEEKERMSKPNNKYHLNEVAIFSSLVYFVTKQRKERKKEKERRVERMKSTQKVWEGSTHATQK